MRVDERDVADDHVVRVVHADVRADDGCAGQAEQRRVRRNGDPDARLLVRLRRAPRVFERAARRRLCPTPLGRRWRGTRRASIRAPSYALHGSGALSCVDVAVNRPGDEDDFRRRTGCRERRDQLLPVRHGVDVVRGRGGSAGRAGRERSPAVVGRQRLVREIVGGRRRFLEGRGLDDVRRGTSRRGEGQRGRRAGGVDASRNLLGGRHYPTQCVV